ncbi:MAG TPA: hypothetical protein VF665_16975 [Longimicrobium sp.]|jgi:hypothetical protein|uniref:hypothetical protein n=1 Tax=Longimicrobium sp. TaxID=2029185 RepID=UPI002ED9C207
MNSRASDTIISIRPKLLACLLGGLLAACGDKPAGEGGAPAAARVDTAGFFDQDLGQAERDSARADTAVRARAAETLRKARADAGLSPDDHGPAAAPAAVSADSGNAYRLCMEKVAAAPPDAQARLREACERSR